MMLSWSSYNLEHFVNAKRLSGAEKAIRDLLFYGIRKTGQLKNQKIGSLFGLSYSGVSHAVRSAKLELAKNRTTRNCRVIPEKGGEK